MLLSGCEPEQRVTLTVKVVEVLIEVVTKHAQITEFLVADSSACAICLTTGAEHEAMTPGSLVRLVNAATAVENGRMVLRLDAFSSLQPAEDEGVMIINLQDNISWVQRELVRV